MTLFLLDTTTITHLRNGHTKAIASQMAYSEPNTGQVIGIASVNVEEVIGGWLSFLQRARTPQQQASGANRLNDSLRFLSRYTLIAITEAAVARHEVLRRMKLNVGRNDLRLAALALELGATVVTDNIRDFGRVPGLSWIDWTK